MRLAKTFQVEENEEYGTLGFRPVDMPDADPLSGVTCAHDLLEHEPGDDGSLAAEFRALGASLWLRGETDYHSRNGSRAHPFEHLAADFPALFAHLYFEGFPLADATEAPEVPAGTAEVLRDAVRQGQADTSDEHEGADGDLGEALATWCGVTTGETLYRWLAIGYAAAVERYAGIDAYTLAHEVFADIEKRLDVYLAVDAIEGETVTVEVDFGAMFAHISVDGELGEYL